MTDHQTVAELRAFNAGIRHVLEHARRIADAIDARPKRRIADGFASEALRALADEADALKLTPQSGYPNPANNSDTRIV